MSDKIIYCTGCDRKVGIIKDAKLLKNLKYLCPNCEIKRLASDMKKKKQSIPIDNFIKDVLKGRI